MSIYKKKEVNILKNEKDFKYLKVKSELHQKLKIESIKNGLSMKDFVNQLISEKLDKLTNKGENND